LSGLSVSGAGKYAKLLPCLYELDAGRILIDGYDSKVELYSLRRQIGVVLQDTLLLGLQENLTNPDATPERL